MSHQHYGSNTDNNASTASYSNNKKQVAKDWARIMQGDDSEDEMSGEETEVMPDTSPSKFNTTTSNSGNNKQPRNTLTTPTKRKPYRRTKRPKNYNDKSTITSATPVAKESKPNVYDAVLGEAEDLLRAASDAQSLGRLKMASNYLLLLHTRLVGLGKKFDRANTKMDGVGSTVSHHQHGSNNADENDEDDHHHGLTPKKLDLGSPKRKRNNGDDDDDEEEEEEDDDQGAVVDDATTRKSRAGSTGSNSNDNDDAQPKVPPSNGISEAALNQLTNYLPDNIEMDQAMVEHLARAAAELHQKRTGKKTNTEEGLLNSPAINTEEVFMHNREPDGSPKPPIHLRAKARTAATTTGTTTTNNSEPQQPTTTTMITTAMEPVSSQNPWTQDEKERFQAAARCTSDATKISQLMGTRTEAQVRAYMSDVGVMTKERKEREGIDDTPRRRSGGRGRKPPTTAMNTVPNANVDAKAMLKKMGMGL